MKQTACFFMTILIVASISLSQPRLYLEKPNIDLGTMYSGMKKQGNITLKNIGDDTLRIISIRPSCGCTAVKQPKAFLLPNESDEAEVEFNSSGYRGKVEKSIDINTNDPVSQHVSVRLIVEVKEELHPISGSTLMWFGNVGIEKSCMKTAFLKNVSGHPIKIKAFTVSSPSINVEIEKRVLNPDDTLEVQVTIKAEKIGHSSGHIVIETDSKNQQHMEMRTSYIGIKEN